MKLFLVRHGQTESRKQGERDDLLRPLNSVGAAQARALCEYLSHGEGLTRLVSSPSLRCQQTLEPLTLASGVAIDVDERLLEGEGVQRALELMPSYGEGPVVFCTHRAVIESILQVFELTPEGEAPVPARKGSVWVLEGPGYSPTTAHYREPSGKRGRSEKTRFEIEPRRSIRAAALDLGSTSFHLLIADVRHDGAIHPVVREKFMLRLGAVIAEHEEVPEDVCERAVAVARDLRQVAEQEKAQILFPVATSALREARNGVELGERIGRALGTRVRVLSGQEEARLIFRAFRDRIPLGSDRCLALDLGGGSLELAAGNRAAVDYEATLKLGVTRLHRELVRRDPMGPGEARAVRERVRESLGSHVDALTRPPPDQIAAAGGTARALLRLIEEERAASGPRPRLPGKLSRKRLRRLCKTLVASSHEERLLMRGMARQRADLLPTGALILSELFDVLEIESLTVSDWGLREGVLLDGLVDR